jgi:hypothetical protein
MNRTEGRGDEKCLRTGQNFLGGRKNEKFVFYFNNISDQCCIFYLQKLLRPLNYLKQFLKIISNKYIINT